MIRIFIFSLLIIHGMIHVMGFVKEFGYGLTGVLNNQRLIQMDGSLTKIVGLAWLFTAVTFLLAGVLYLIRSDLSWILLIVAITTSQILILLYWRDARFGTIVNLILLIVVIFSAAKDQFEKNYKSAAHALVDNIADNSVFVTEDSVRKLPGCVRRWLEQSNVVGRSNPNVIHIYQRGTMRMKPDAGWMPFEAEEYFTIDPPSFVWKAHISASPFLTIGGRDKYENGVGNMVIKPMYVYTLADAKGPEIDQGTLLRFLGEMTWFPQAAVSEYLRWEEIDSLHARATMAYKGVSASGIFTFDPEGFVTGFEARRYGDFDGEHRLETWVVTVTGYKTMGDKIIGNKNDVTWKLKTGDFLWMKMEVTDIQ